MRHRSSGHPESQTAVAPPAVCPLLGSCCTEQAADAHMPSMCCAVLCCAVALLSPACAVLCCALQMTPLHMA